MKKIFLFSFILLLFVFLPNSYAENEDKLVILNTKSGDIVIEFFPEDAPQHVENFISLAEEGFYDRTVFHRVIPDFMIQGGDPKTKPGGYDSVTEWGTGNPGYTIEAEFNTIKHNRGIVSMARSADHDSAGSQFFIVHQDSNFLDEQYTVFGRIVTELSFETLDTIANLETPPDGTIPFKWGDGEILTAKVVERTSVDNVLDLGEPERITESITPTEVGPYTNEKLGITFDAPEGWLIQEPEKTDPFVPDLVLVGSQINGFNPAISITVDLRNERSLNEKIIQSNEFLQDAIDSGQLEIISEEKTTINGMEASQKNAKGEFVMSGVTANIIFREVILVTSDNFYTITYSNEENNFNDNLGKLNNILYSFSIQSEVVNSNGEPPGGGCLIATAAYGSELAPQVQFLREVRDNTLLSTESGSSFMGGFNSLYYSFSPAVADLERESPVFREAVKLFITPMLSTLSIMTLADEGSESQVLGLGISVIALNLGMYIAAPAIIISRLRK